MRYITVLFFILTVGCASQPKAPAVDTPIVDSRQIPTPLVSETMTHAPTTQELLNSASEYLSRAETALPAERADFRIKAAAALIQAGRHDPAWRLLNATDVAGLTPTFGVRRLLLQARIAIYKNRPNQALVLLSDLETRPGLSPQLYEQLWQIRAWAKLTQSRPIDAIADLITREQYLTEPNKLSENQRQIWALLNRTSKNKLLETRQSPGNVELAGWVDLALIHMEHSYNRFRLNNEFRQWQTLHPEHGANAFIQNRTTAITGLPRIQARRIALLLPLASEYGRAAQAVHDGIMAVHTANDDPHKPDISVYDIGAEAELAPVYYRLAMQEGSDLIVGPLGKQAVNALISAGSLSVPTVLLGSAQNIEALPPNTFQFDLSPEQDAEQTALRAYLDGHRIAAVLYPETEWGERVRDVFNQRWQELGGIVVESRSYVDDATDFSIPIRKLLNIERSEARKRELSALIRTRLEFQPRRRQDLDFLFLAAKPSTARLLKPQLNFYQAHDVLVYATSHVFSGKPDPVNDADLNGIVFGDMPWILVNDGWIQSVRQNIQGAWPYAYSSIDRLFALGMDTYAIIPVLDRLREDQSFSIAGVTANLSMDRNGRVIRHLSWARFEDGRPVSHDIPTGDNRLDNYGYGNTTFGSSLETRKMGGEPRP